MLPPEKADGKLRVDPKAVKTSPRDTVNIRVGLRRNAPKNQTSKTCFRHSNESHCNAIRLLIMLATRHHFICAAVVLLLVAHSEMNNVFSCVCVVIDDVEQWIQAWE